MRPKRGAPAVPAPDGFPRIFDIAVRRIPIFLRHRNCPPLSKHLFSVNRFFGSRSRERKSAFIVQRQQMASLKMLAY
jgi:hypothetical protein